MGESSPDYWGILDPEFTKIRRKLYSDPSWRYGPHRVHQVAKRVYDNLSRHRSIVGLRFADIGAGCHHPFGTSAILYINGLSFAAAFDSSGTEERRAAEALYDLLVACLIEPSSWHWSEIPRDTFLRNIHRFNLVALRDGDLEAGLSDVPIKHLIGDLAAPPFQPGSLDLMSSQAVMEHFLDYKLIFRRLYELLAPGGQGYHRVDLRDHRAYAQPNRFNAWSFLTEDDSWSDGLCNRLRLSEFVCELQEAGFKVEVLATARAPLPFGLRPQLRGRFANMPDEELEVQSFDCLTSR